MRVKQESSFAKFVRRSSRWLACVMLTAALSGCAAKLETPSVRLTPMPPDLSDVEAPVRFEGLCHEENVRFWLPEEKNNVLTERSACLTLDRSTFDEELILRQLLALPSDGHTAALGKEGVQLELYGPEPVEIAGSICTVNLSPSALLLDYEDLYTACLSMAATLGRNCGVDYVNVLIADQAIALDVSGILPGGAVADPGETDMHESWTKLTARRVPLGTEAVSRPMTMDMTLYRPLRDGKGIYPEVRSVTFPGQTLRQMVTGLLRAMSQPAAGSDKVQTLPELTAMLIREPAVQEMETGGRMVTLQFAEELERRLNVLGIDPTCFIASLTYTITTGIPSVSTVRIMSGDKPVERLYSKEFGEFSFADGMMRRRQFSRILMDSLDVWMLKGQKLVRVSQTIPWRDNRRPGALLQAMIAAPDAAALQGIERLLPEGLDDSDLLGLAVQGDLLLADLSPRFAGLIAAAGTEHEQLLCYSLVTTLCERYDTRRVRFFFGGEVRQTLAGFLSWDGDFYLNYALTEQAKG